MAGVLLGIRYFQSKESVEIRKKDAASHIKKEHPMKIPKEAEKEQIELEIETEIVSEMQAGDVVEDSVITQTVWSSFL